MPTPLVAQSSSNSIQLSADISKLYNEACSSASVPVEAIECYQSVGKYNFDRDYIDPILTSLVNLEASIVCSYTELKSYFIFERDPNLIKVFF